MDTLFLFILATIILIVLRTIWSPFAFVKSEEEAAELMKKYYDTETSTMVNVNRFLVTGKLAVLSLKDGILTCESKEGVLFSAPFDRVSVRSEYFKNMRFFLHNEKKQVYRIFFRKSSEQKIWKDIFAHRYFNTKN